MELAVHWSRRDLRLEDNTALFVHTNPAFCCPSRVTEAMTNEIKRNTGVPVITITYDGTDEYTNDVIIPYLQGKLVAG